jgi:amidophosphoribosyltransferase
VEIKALDPKAINYDEQLDKILAFRTRAEKIMVKDAKLRTFITQDDSRDEMVAHVYDITYGSLRRHEDTVVIIDDSIVRGTTLKQSVIRILDRLQPKKIVIVSSAPQIRYPDCYGIDMAKIGDFIAFQAAIELLKDRGMENIIDKVYKKCKSSEEANTIKDENHVKLIYQSFDDQEISDKIATLLKHENINSELKIIFQTVDNLHIACPGHTGDWYFTGDYPTPGGNKVVNKSFINYIEGIDKRAY